MRIFVVIFLVLVGMAVSIRIDGIWPPKPLHEPVELVVSHIVKPGKTLLIALGQHMSLKPVRWGPDATIQSASMMRAVVDNDPASEQSTMPCS
ncbi:MAG TPA: hypothetical protein VK972_09705 [Wenzhouxiangella sp.]|nr:hypothetical protein [Wenzhouxiangella sp.]